MLWLLRARNQDITENMRVYVPLLPYIRCHLTYEGTGLTLFNVSGAKSHVVFTNFSAAAKAERTVFFIIIATVIGPTPPGTGVMYEATCFASSKRTSPTNRVPFCFVVSLAYK